MWAGVVTGLVSLHTPGNGVGEAVAEMDPGITKPDPCKCGGQVHLRAGLEVILVIDSPSEVFSEKMSRIITTFCSLRLLLCSLSLTAPDCLQRLPGPDVRDGVGALVGGPSQGRHGPG